MSEYKLPFDISKVKFLTPDMVPANIRAALLLYDYPRLEMRIEQDTTWAYTFRCPILKYAPFLNAMLALGYHCEVHPETMNGDQLVYVMVPK